jgi:hypothetical protein
MTTIVLSCDTCPALRARYRHYLRVQRRTPSGRVYDSVSIIFRDGSGSIHTSELTRDASRAIAGVSRCEFAAREEV